MDKYCVYIHRNNINNKIYIGMTKDVQTRWRNNGIAYKPYGGVSHFWEAIQKYGWNNFSHEILENNLSKEQAELKEQMYIFLWDSRNRECGYNIAEGGNGGTIYLTHPRGMKGKKHSRDWSIKHSEDIKKATDRGCYKDMWKNKEHPRGMKGKPQTTKQRMSASKGEVIIILPSGEKLSFISMKEAGRTLGIPDGILSRVCKDGIVYEAYRTTPQYSHYNGMKVIRLPKKDNTEVTGD